MIYKFKYLDLPVNMHVKPLDVLIKKATLGETIEVFSPQEIQEIVQEKYRSGWKYLTKDENEDGTCNLFFVKEIKRNSIFE